MSEVRQNKPSPEGKKLGRELARLTDIAMHEVIKSFPNHDWPCQSCAYKLGTFPNGCLTTVADAIKCAVEGIPFYCHQIFDSDGKATDLCAGWMVARAVLKDFPIAKLPYELSDQTVDDLA